MNKKREFESLINFFNINFLGIFGKIYTYVLVPIDILVNLEGYNYKIILRIFAGMP